MKIKCLKLKNWLLVSLGGLLGVSLSGCDTAVEVEYGCPEADYRVKGTVVDKDGHSIEGIGVGREYFPHNDTGEDEGWRYLDTTGADGRFDVTFRHFPTGKDTIYVNFDDIAWNQHGNYQSTVVPVSFVGASFTGSSDRYEGCATREISVTLQSTE